MDCKKERPIKQEEEFETNDEKYSMTLESFVVKEEPILEQEIDTEKDSSLPTKIEANFDDESSTDDDDVPLKNRKKVKNSVIECPICDFKTNRKGTYRAHVTRIHNRQQLICDGCDKTSHLIYILLKHRKKEHNFTHEYNAVAVPTDEIKIETKSKRKREEKEIICPLCDYKTNIKNNYTTHVFQTHKRQELQCEKCDYKNHLIYNLEKHRKEKHNLDTKYEVDEALKMKVVRIHRKCKSFMDPSIGGSADSYCCPLCPFKHIKLGQLNMHYKKVHKKVEMPCDGCSAKFYLYYRLLQHRKLVHNFDHPYVVPESIMLEENNRKEQFRIEKRKNYPCPKCDCWFKNRQYVAEHLRKYH